MRSCAALAISMTLTLPAAAGDGDCGSEDPYLSDLEPRGAQTVLGGGQKRTPIARFPIDRARCFGVALPFEVSMRVEGVSAFTLDREGTAYGPRVLFAPRTRGGVMMSTGDALAPAVLVAGVEVELSSANLSRSPGVAGIGYLGEDERVVSLRRAGARFAFADAIYLGAGWTTSHWGLGLLANDGDHGWQPGSARFSDPRGGDNPLRFFFGTGPITSAKLRMSVAGDFLDHRLLTDDDILYDGDFASQAIAAITVGDDLDKPLARENTCGASSCGIGVYAAVRRQESFYEKETRVLAIDVTGHARVPFGATQLGWFFEAVGIGGSTELGPVERFEERDVLQFGAALRMSVDRPRFGAVVDAVFASGDDEPDDGFVRDFKSDPNFELGLLLFRHVIAAQSARAAFRAGDNRLLPIPARDRELVPSYGGVTNTVAVFPRFRVRPFTGFEAYAGPLVALAPEPVADPVESRIAGAPRTALGELEAHWLGTEIDLGLRYRLNIGGAELTVGSEGGVLLPGRALLDPSERVWGGRIMMDAKL